MIRSWLGPLLQIFNRVLDWMDARERQVDYEKRQAKRDKAAQDPAASFRDHFGGLRDNREPDADKTDKADPGDTGKPKRS